MNNETLHIAYSELKSNFRLRGERLPLKATVYTSVETPDGGTWENEGGALAPEPVEVEDLWRYRSSVSPGLPRKQKAARAYVPKESITIVPLSKPPVDHPLTVMLRVEQWNQEEKEK